MRIATSNIDWTEPLRSFSSPLAGFPAITLDTDWAPDFVIDFVAEILLGACVKATWFITHASPAIDRLRKHPELFELGLHPNFMTGSSHGTAVADVIAYCSALVPDATCMRTHGLLQSTNIFAQVATALPRLETDLSLFLPRARYAEPVELPVGGRVIQRLPYIWEDDVEMMREDPWWSFDRFPRLEGLAIFDFHPIHLYINSPTFASYEQLKKSVISIFDAKPHDMATQPESAPGPGYLFRDIVARLVAAGRSYRVSDLTSAVRESRLAL